jgi:hypothetical protein
MNWVRYAMQWIIDDAIERTPKGGVWVEIGVGTGRGIGYMARALIESGRDDVTLYAVDPWAGTARCGEQTRVQPEASAHGDWSLFLDMMQTHAPRELRRIHIMRAESEWAAKAIGLCDLVIVDGDHSYNAVRTDMRTWAPLCRGVLGGDDMVAGSDVERAVLEQWPDVERRGNPHSDGGQADWPTWRKVLA